MNPSGLCLCGCGGKTKIASCTYRKRGWVKGEPVDYIHGHYAKAVPRGKTIAANMDNGSTIVFVDYGDGPIVGMETMQARRRRTQKQGPYKAGATLKAKAAVGKIEAAMRRRG